MGKAVNKVDLEKNRIYISIAGFMTVDEARELIEDYRRAIEQCNPGFTVLADLSKYKPGKPEVQAILAEGPRMAGEAGCAKVARVVLGGNPLGAMQIDRIAQTESGYQARHFDNVAEAEAYLDSEADCD